MKIDELHALQEELAKKLEITNSLLQSKLTNSHKKEHGDRSNDKIPVKISKSGALNSFRGGSAAKKLNNLDEGKIAKLLQKAQSELQDEEEPDKGTPKPQKRAPEPESLSKKEEILAQKMQIFKEIQQRLTDPRPNRFE